MNRRRTVSAATLCAVALVASACGNGGDSKGSGSKELNIISIATPSGPGYATLQKAISTFEQQSGAKLNLTTAAGDSVISQFESSSLAGNEADVVNINPVGNVRNWLKSGAIVDANQYLDSWGLKDTVNPEAVKQWTLDGQLQGFPYETFTWPLWLNMDLLAKAGITAAPATLDELQADAAKLKAAGITPLAVGGSDWTGQDMLQRFIQLYLPTSDYPDVFGSGKYCANQHAMDALTEVTRLRDAGLFAKNVQGLTSNDMNTAFYTGKAAMMLAGSWAFGDVPKALAPHIAFTGLPLPASGAAVSKPAFAVGYTSAGWLISKNGAKKGDLIKQFLKIIYSDETVKETISSAGFVPAVAKVPDLPADASPLVTASIKAVAATDRLVPTDAWVPPSVVSSYTQGSSVAYTPGKSAADVCKALEKVYASAK
ncbi:ABC transporter substrate-binding protein [Plantactinospora siamensis]|uniref:ABC transporter substrate-binding protein n=1 Tax=Plantactinospora siamensis TaxID=555372 RepID=A0ABV6P3D4_9ACTN